MNSLKDLPFYLPFSCYIFIIIFSIILLLEYLTSCTIRLIYIVNYLQDLQASIRRVADFLGKSLTSEEIKRLSDHLSFKNLKNNKSVNQESLREYGMLESNECFIRKGQYLLEYHANYVWIFFMVLVCNQNYFYTRQVWRLARLLRCGNDWASRTMDHRQPTRYRSTISKFWDELKTNNLFEFFLACVVLLLYKPT